MKAICPPVILFFMLIACNKPSLSPDRDLATLQERFHGKYKPISSTSSETIDVNLDGVASTDMFNEIRDLPNSNVEVRIYAIDNSLFIQFWPEQYFADRITPGNYTANMHITYANQSSTRLFTFAPDLKKLNIKPDATPLPDSIHFPFPDSVTIKDNDRIQVVSPKQLFTRDGWKKVTITTLYERYTKAT